ncbi:hypothetical protein GZ77_20650 [Endozoicomonas montiporae]|uniref:Recombination-associated protein RdgC n=2 Tax=Endozoicomonas montiporae TaxID=1027273 RepID=A0A081N331_9GAMM|nr:recombination-associated protein RdgC [Endozoicomonas montiporae]AMO58147.1 recombination-associated protein RdgC [Endozoicomonas montiporae CL-33]KEQ12854.1 hypothetical protein GZ77_20650 [Endozoicomonas montiporae]
MKASSLLFKNLIFYRFTQPFTLNAMELQDRLRSKKFRPCGTQDMTSYGWVPALSKRSTALVHENNHCLLICAASEEKLLPASVINDALEERIERIEQEQDRQVFSKERRTIKDDIIMELLPKAFTKQKFTRAYIDKTEGWLVVNASSFRQAEDLTSYLRHTLGSLPVVTPALKESPNAVMTQWLSSRLLPKGFALCYDCELIDPGEDGGKIIARNEELNTDAIHQHLDEGKAVSKLAIDWRETLHGYLTDDVRFQRLKFSDLFHEQIDAQSLEGLEQQLDADFIAMSGTLRHFLKELVKALGGMPS